MPSCYKIFCVSRIVAHLSWYILAVSSRSPALKYNSMNIHIYAQNLKNSTGQNCLMWLT